MNTDGGVLQDDAALRRNAERFGAEQVHEAGLKVQTTLDLDLQQTANRAVLDGLASYERKRGWKGAQQNVLTQGGGLEEYKHPDWVMRVQPGEVEVAWAAIAGTTIWEGKVPYLDTEPVHKALLATFNFGERIGT